MIGNIVCGQKNNENNIDIKGDIIEARVGSEQINKGDFVNIVQNKAVNYNTYELPIKTNFYRMLELEDNKVFIMWVDSSSERSNWKISLYDISNSAEAIEIFTYDFFDSYNGKQWMPKIHDLGNNKLLITFKVTASLKGMLCEIKDNNVYINGQLLTEMIQLSSNDPLVSMEGRIATGDREAIGISKDKFIFFYDRCAITSPTSSAPHGLFYRICTINKDGSLSIGSQNTISIDDNIGGMTIQKIYSYKISDDKILITYCKNKENTENEFILTMTELDINTNIFTNDLISIDTNYYTTYLFLLDNNRIGIVYKKDNNSSTSTSIMLNIYNKENWNLIRSLQLISTSNSEYEETWFKVDVLPQNAILLTHQDTTRSLNSDNTTYTYTSGLETAVYYLNTSTFRFDRYSPYNTNKSLLALTTGTADKPETLSIFNKNTFVVNNDKTSLKLARMKWDNFLTLPILNYNSDIGIALQAGDYNNIIKVSCKNYYNFYNAFVDTYALSNYNYFREYNDWYQPVWTNETNYNGIAGTKVIIRCNRPCLFIFNERVSTISGATGTVLTGYLSNLDQSLSNTKVNITSYKSKFEFGNVSRDLINHVYYLDGDNIDHFVQYKLFDDLYQSRKYFRYF